MTFDLSAFQFAERAVANFAVVNHFAADKLELAEVGEFLFLSRSGRTQQRRERCE